MSTKHVLREIFDRVAAAAGVRTDAEVARELRVKPQALANWKTRGTVPFEALCAFATKRGLTLDYLLFGTEPKFRRQTEIDARLLAGIGAALDSMSPRELKSRMTFAEKYWYIGFVYNRLLRLPEAARETAASDEVAFLLSLLLGGEHDFSDIDRLMEAANVKRPTKKLAKR